MEAEFYAYRGIDRLVDIIKQVKENYNPGLTIGGVFITKYNAQRILTNSITDSVKKYFDNKLFETKIRQNVALAEAPTKGLDIFRYNDESNGAKDYTELVNEIVEKV
jgi:chromosome partitioning protein